MTLLDEAKTAASPSHDIFYFILIFLLIIAIFAIIFSILIYKLAQVIAHYLLELKAMDANKELSKEGKKQISAYLPTQANQTKNAASDKQSSSSTIPFLKSDVLYANDKKDLFRK